MLLWRERKAIAVFHWPHEWRWCNIRIYDACMLANGIMRSLVKSGNSPVCLRLSPPIVNRMSIMKGVIDITFCYIVEDDWKKFHSEACSFGLFSCNQGNICLVVQLPRLAE